MSSPQAVQEIRRRLVRIGAIASPARQPITLPHGHREQTLALYRSMIREAKKITHDTHLRQYFLQWFRSSFKKNKEVKTTELLRTKRRRAEVELRRIQRANSGGVDALERALSLAYGRRGPLRHTLLKNIVAEPTGTSTKPLVSTDPRSIPPPYPPLLTHMLKDHNHTTKVLDNKKLTLPLDVPARANPDSAEARIIGPLPKRRERWMRWNYWIRNVKRLRLPIDSVFPAEPGINSSVPWSIPSIAGGTPRLERLANGLGDDGSQLPRRMRRLYGFLLGEIPTVKWSSLVPWQTSVQDSADDPIPTIPPELTTKTPTTGRYHSSLSPAALVRNNPAAMRIPPISKDDQEWILRAAAQDAIPKPVVRLRRKREVTGCASQS